MGFQSREPPEVLQKFYDSLHGRYALMCKVFVMTLRGAAKDWFYTLPSRSINNLKELALFFTKKYTTYRTIKKNRDHLFHLNKKHDESLRDCSNIFKSEKANIVGYDDRITSSAFKKDLPTKHDLHRELTIAPSQILAEAFGPAKHYELWDDNRIAMKKSTRQANQPAKECPNDNFPLPRIDQLVNSTSGNQLLNFMDPYSGYNQIMIQGLRS
ncbi:unnamed protein product [Prunus armeniaca]